MSLKNGKDSIIIVPKKNTDSTVFAQNIISSDNLLYKCIGMLCYMSLKVEKQAFLSQTIQELKGLGRNQFNYKEKLKETVLYNNLTKGYRMFCNGMKNTNSNDLYALNASVISIYPQSNIPKCDVKVFNVTEYNRKLIK